VAGFADAETGAKGMGLTRAVIVFEVAGLPEEQVAFEVRTQTMRSLFEREASV